MLKYKNKLIKTLKTVFLNFEKVLEARLYMMPLHVRFGASPQDRDVFFITFKT